MPYPSVRMLFPSILCSVLGLACGSSDGSASASSSGDSSGSTGGSTGTTTGSTTSTGESSSVGGAPEATSGGNAAGGATNGSTTAGGTGTGTGGGGSGSGSGGGGGGSTGSVDFAGPPMGFNPYNSFWTNATELQMRAFADAIAKNGMKEAGYTYVNVDEGWAGSRDQNGTMQTGPKYKSGIKALADYIHGKGLKFGIYTAPGSKGCSNENTGSVGHETQDVNTYATWGVDYIKLDWCGADYSANGAAVIATTWKNAIAATGRPMILSINAGANTGVAPWASTRVNMWRVGDDICDTWLNKTGNVNPGTSHCTDKKYQSGIFDYLTMNLDYLAQYSGQGHWGDPDMLQVGNPGLPLEEAKTHFSIWAMWSAPLVAGNDVTKMDGSDIASKVLLNSEVIAIDQDPKNVWATRIKSTNAVQIYKKPLAASGTMAVALVNMNGAPQDILVKWSDLGWSSVTAIRDLWAHSDVPSNGSGYTATQIPSHGTVMLKLTGK